MLSDAELKDRLGFILGIEEHGARADWFAIARLSAEVLEALPESAPPVAKAYLSDSHIRRVNANYAIHQRRELIDYLRS